MCDEAMTKMGISDADKLGVFMLVAGVLHLGNVAFEENMEDAKGEVCSVQYNTVLNNVVQYNTNYYNIE